MARTIYVYDGWEGCTCSEIGAGKTSSAYVSVVCVVCLISVA